MRARFACAVVATALALTGCASADPVVRMETSPSDGGDPAAATEVLTTVLTEIDAHFLAASQTPASIISAGATVDVAVAELTEALDLSDGVRDFAAATATEVSRDAQEAVTAVVEPGEPAVVGAVDGDPVATVTLLQSVERDAGPTTETSTTYAMTLDGDRLADVGAWIPGLDSGTSLSSPLGAARRYLDLVAAGETEAVRYFSGGVNSESEIGVLATASDGVALTLLELPQFQMGNGHVVYAVDGDGSVVGRFEVLLGSSTQVVYSPTS